MINSKKLLMIVLLCVASSSAAAAQTSFVTIDGRKVHPTRILAKYSTQARAITQNSISSTFGLREHRRFSQIPGLTIFEDQKAPLRQPLTVAADEVDTYRQALVDHIGRMQASGLFEYVEPDYILSASLIPTDQAFTDGTLWGLRNAGQNGGRPGADIDAVRAWDITTGSTNVVVAVIDTGIRYTHQDLATQVWVNPAEIPGNGMDDDGNGIIDDIYGFNAINDSGDPLDDNNHGTHVSGTLGAAANNGFPHVGVAWTVQIMACKFLNAQGFGSTSDAIKCIDYAVNMGAKILNNSWGGGPFDPALFDAINRARRAEVLFVAAAGNDGEDNDVSPHYPSSYGLDNIIAVAALDRSDNLAFFSNFGRTSVDLGAPGAEIYSTTAGSDREYQVFNGTSQATPHVSGVAALIASQFPGAPLSEVRDRILFSVVPIASLRNRTTTGGRLNAYNALTISGGPNLGISVDPPSGSSILSSTNTPFFVQVSSLFGIRDATVVGTFSGLTNFMTTFANDGNAPDALAMDAVYSADLPALGTTGTLTLTIVATATNKVASTNTAVYTVVPRPPNDNFANAIKVPAGGSFYLSNNRFATLEPGEPVHGGVVAADASLWWAWTASSNGTVLIDTTGSAIDTVIGVYRGSALVGLMPVAVTNTAGQSPQASLTFSATNGITYRIAIAGADSGQTGSIRLRVAPEGRLDTQPPVVFISSPVSGSTVSSNQVLVLGTAVDPQPDSSGLREVLVRLNDDVAFPANGTTNWAALLRLQQGRNVIAVRADDHADHSSALVQIEVRYQPQDPVNDLFANAVELTDPSGTVSVSTTNASRETGEPFHAGNAGGKSVWWFFRASQDGTLLLSTTNSTFDTLLGVYQGTRVNALTALASNDDAAEGVPFSKVTQAVRADEIYRIALDGFDGAFGVASLSYQFMPSAVYHLAVDATAGGAVSPGSGEIAGGSTIVLQASPDFGYEFVGWEGSLVSTDNPLSVVVSGDLTLTARFRLHSFTDGFETGGFSALPWSFGSAAPWTVQSNYVSLGTFAARSGAITNSQRSSLLLSRNTAAGFGSFDLRVSSETGWDWLEFYVNGALNQHWSGDVGWQTYVFTLPAGTNTLEWRYVKDVSVSLGLDAAFIDNVDLPLTATSISLLSASAGGAKLSLKAQANYTYVIQASTDLRAWQPISTNHAVNGLIQVTDPEALRYPLRFYRAVGR